MSWKFYSQVQFSGCQFFKLKYEILLFYSVDFKAIDSATVLLGPYYNRIFIIAEWAAVALAEFPAVHRLIEYMTGLWFSLIPSFSKRNSEVIVTVASKPTRVFWLLY